ncbi:MAG: hypothetical protein WBQ32_02075 [Ignavibacteriaceae bacterium]
MQKAAKPSKEECIELLVFNKEDLLEQKIDFRWIHSREFKYNGEMYDVVKRAEDNKQIFLYCINDEKEKKLEEEFEKGVHKNSSENKQRPTTYNHFNILLSEPVKSEQTGIALVQGYGFKFWLTVSYNSPNIEIPSPPPRCV